jgi:hypothetical protein
MGPAMTAELVVAAALPPPTLMMVGMPVESAAKPLIMTVSYWYEQLEEF